jgi:hypothetical protein
MSTPALAYGPATYCAGDTSGGSPPPAVVESTVGCEDGFDESSTVIVGGMIRCDEGWKNGSSLEKLLGNEEGPNNESDDGLPVAKSLKDGFVRFVFPAFPIFIESFVLILFLDKKSLLTPVP